jgi:hypothetical protein
MRYSDILASTNPKIMNVRTFRLILALSFLSNIVWAQLPSNRVSPGVMHYAGDTVRSIRLGLYTIIPAGWKGVLPRDTEVVVLVPEENSSSTIYAVLNEHMTLAQQKISMQTGFELADGLTMTPEGTVTQRGSDIIATNAKLSGEKANKQAKFYIESKCNPVGYCLAFVLSAGAADMEKGKAALQKLVDNTTFQDMSHISPFARFDWKEFLSNKILLRFNHDASGKQEDELNLCKDGTFKSRITRSGGFDVPTRQYEGKNNGTWSVVKNDSKATITLTFKKLKPITLQLEAKDEEIYVNGQRYFVGESETCK